MSPSESYSDKILIGEFQEFREILLNYFYSSEFQLSLVVENVIEVIKGKEKIRVDFLEIIPGKEGNILHYNINAKSPASERSWLFAFVSFIMLLLSLVSIIFIVFLILFLLLHIVTKPQKPDLKLLISEADRIIFQAANESHEMMRARVSPPELPKLKSSGPFSHGVEREYAIVTRSGKMHRDIAGFATKAFEKIINELPPYYTHPNIDGRKFRLIGRDEAYPTQLEIATRVCHDLDDLEKELRHLVGLAIKSVKKAGYEVLASGAHPFEEPNLGEFFSEHHHIGTSSNREKIWIHNMIRNFIPEIMALTVNSPILLGKPCGVKSIRMDTRNPNVGPIDGVPYLTSYNSEQTANLIKKGDPRLMDVTPFSRYSTVEIRIMDNQISIERSVAIAAVLEALALKARKMMEENKPVPRVSQEVLGKNREAALIHGLSAIFNVDNNIKLAYHGSGKNKIRAFGAVEEVLKFILPELHEIGAKNRHLMPIIASIKLARAGKGGTLADWQLQAFKSFMEDSSGKELKNAFLDFLMSESSLNPGIDPICKIADVREDDVIKILGISLREEGEEEVYEVCPICGSHLDPHSRFCEKCRVYWT
jgi:carboxylate-amine ligase